MAGDYTRINFNARKNYSAVWKQQGRVSLDSDWNEGAEINDRRWRSATLDIVGRCVVPETTIDAFRVTPTDLGRFDIGMGRAYVDGIQIESHGLAPLRYDPVLGEQRGTMEVPYRNQPYYPQPLPPSLLPDPPSGIAGRRDLVYLDVWQREVTAIEDPQLLEIALGGPDTTTRVQTIWQVKVLQNIGDARCASELEAWHDSTAPSAGRLSSDAEPPPPDEGPCVINPAGGYRGLENRLYRVEVHTPGPLGTAGFKWSRDNASLVSAVESLNDDQVKLEDLGRDEVMRFHVGDWIEILDDHREFAGRAGHMAQIESIDAANRLVTLTANIPPEFDFDPSDPARHTRVRRWDQSGDDVEDSGLLTVEAGPIAIERGVRVQFSIDDDHPDGEFRVGDYWVFSARTADGSVESLQAAPPRGIKHHYCRLAVIEWDTSIESTRVEDCRTLWPPARCCPIAVRPGEDIQAAIDKAPEDGGCVCLLPGIHRLDRPLRIDARQNLTLHGTGAATKVVFTPRRQTPFQSMVYVAGASRDIRIEDVLFYADQALHLMVVDEGSEQVAVKRCTMINAWIEKPAGALDQGGDCFLLGEACRFSVSDSKLVAANPVLQATPALLVAARGELANLREPAAPGSDNQDNAEQTPLSAPTLIGLELLGNELYFLDHGVRVLDLRQGNIRRNRLCAVTSERAAKFVHVPDAATGEFTGPNSDAFYAELDDLVAEFSVCAGSQPALIPPLTFGMLACVSEDLVVQGNTITATVGVVLNYTRRASARRNRIRAGMAAVAVGYGFDVNIRHNRIRIEPRLHDGKQSVEEKWFSGIGTFAARGLKIRHNQIDAWHGIRASRRAVAPCPGVEPQSLLRVLGIERVWRVTVELIWFFYRLFSVLSVVSTNTDGANERRNPVDKEEFERLLFARLIAVLTADFIPASIGKADISYNQLRVQGCGVYFEDVLALGGMRVSNNRISGHHITGIVVYPWFSLGLVDGMAVLLRCILIWLLEFLILLRDALGGFSMEIRPTSRRVREYGDSSLRESRG